MLFRFLHAKVVEDTVLRVTFSGLYMATVDAVRLGWEFVTFDEDNSSSHSC